VGEHKFVSHPQSNSAHEICPLTVQPLASLRKPKAIGPQDKLKFLDHGLVHREIVALPTITLWRAEIAGLHAAKIDDQLL